MGKTIGVVETLVERVLNNVDYEGNSTIKRVNRNGQEVYSAKVVENVLTFRHYGTITLQFDLVNRQIMTWYGQSRSDADSLNTVLDVLRHDSTERFTYRPVNGGFQFVE